VTRSVESIFDELVDLDPESRIQALDRYCTDNESLRHEVESLLAAHDASSKFLGDPTLDHAVLPSGRATESTGKSAHATISEGPGSNVDRYKLLEKIGEGGFGVVYMAQQTEPIRRRVALKIIKLGMDTQQVVARFEAERQALALMDHPNIARVIDGGSTETGRPYFVMELVRGETITAYCDQKQLPLRARLELFQQVCRAIEHAHQKGVIHRDIKPSNVLVTIADDKPVVKVIDFGIAKATSSDLTNKTLFTEFRQLLGTPLYMSPEQAERSGVDIDTRSDIYSLGVLLYEMLTGRTPLDPKRLNAAAWGELQRMIVEDEPTKPSIMVTTSLKSDLDQVAKKRSLQPNRLGILLRGDLDWIVLKALEKDRTRRYSTASQFSADIERFLRDESVEATPPSKVYQIRKFARRHRGLLATLSAVFIALMVGLAGTSFGMIRAATSAQAARNALEFARSNELRAQRAAMLAGASLTLTESDARRLAANWKAEIESAKTETSADEISLVRNEAQYVNWFANWLSSRGFHEESSDLLSNVYANAKEKLGLADPTFLALCNTSVLIGNKMDSEPSVVAQRFDDLVQAMTNVHGDEQASLLLPEYAAALVKVGRKEDAEAAVTKYLTIRSSTNRPLTQVENAKLDLAIDQIMNSRQEYPELIANLRRVRQTGIVIQAKSSQENDAELGQDLKSLQGKWRYKGWRSGKVTEHMIIEISGDECVTRWLDEESKTIRGRTGRVQLSRSGSVKVFTMFLGGDSAEGASFIYHLQPHQFAIVSSMLANTTSLPEIEMRKFFRMKDGEAD
jgi:Protein kinase domain